MTAYFPKNPRSIHVFLTPFLRIETDPTARAIGSKLSPAVFSAVREKSFVLSGLKFEVQASLTVEAGCSQRFFFTRTFFWCTRSAPPRLGMARAV